MKDLFDVRPFVLLFLFFFRRQFWSTNSKSKELKVSYEVYQLPFRDLRRRFWRGQPCRLYRGIVHGWVNCLVGKDLETKHRLIVVSSNLLRAVLSFFLSFSLSFFLSSFSFSFSFFLSSCGMFFYLI